MPQTVSKRLRKLIKCIYFYKQTSDSPVVWFSVMTDDGKYAEFSFRTYCEKLGPTVIRKLRSFFQTFELDNNTDVTFSEEFSKYDGLRYYFELIRDHVKFRISTLDLRRVVRGIVRKHPRSVMTKREIAAKRRGSRNPDKVDEKKLKRVWKYLVGKKTGIKCPWISREADNWLANKTFILAKKYMQMRLAMYYMALKNDFYGIEAMRDLNRMKVYCWRDKNWPKIDIDEL